MEAHHGCYHWGLQFEYYQKEKKKKKNMELFTRTALEGISNSMAGQSAPPPSSLVAVRMLQWLTGCVFDNSWRVRVLLLGLCAIAEDTMSRAIQPQITTSLRNL